MFYIVDAIIIILLITTFLRGKEIGFIRQFFSSIGFFGGLWLGSRLQHVTAGLAHTTTARALISLVTTLGCAFLLLNAFEYLGVRLKERVHYTRFNIADRGFGAFLGAVTLLLGVWLTAAILISWPSPSLQTAIKNSHIVAALNRNLPPAQDLIADVNHLINPNGFPDVFTGLEPKPSENITLPSSSAMQAAVNLAKHSVVKIEGQGCGGIVEGSGFVVGRNLVVTNAHVVAGISDPRVIDDNGTHHTQVISFDSKLDLAILRVSNLAGQPLLLMGGVPATNTPAVVMGYPGGGNLTAGTAAVSSTFTATGRDIYNRSTTERSVEELRAHVIPGNSGGPVLDKKGEVIGVVFATSTSYNNVGYALSMDKVIHEVSTAKTADTPVSSGTCAD